MLNITAQTVVDTYKSYQALLVYQYEQLKKNYLNLALKSISKSEAQSPILPITIADIKTNSFTSYLSKD